MQTTRRAQNHAPIPLIAAVLAAFIIPFLTGCSKTPEEHAEIAADPLADFEKRMASVRALAATGGQQMLLADVAADSRNWRVWRSPPAAKIEAVLADDERIRRAAADRLDEPQAIAAFAKKTGWEGGVDIAAGMMGKMTDRRLLEDIAANASSAFVHVEALSLLDDQAALADIVKNGTDRKLRFFALEKLTDQQTLAALARMAFPMNDAAGVDIAQAAWDKLTDSAILATLERGNLADLINAGKLLAEIKGDTIHKVDITLRKLAPHPLEVTIPAGTYFVCDNARAQNMVSTADVTLRLLGDSQHTGTPAAGTTRPRDIPGVLDSFRLGAPTNAGGLAKLVAAFGRNKGSDHTKQAAVWIVTDDASYDDLGVLLHGPGGRRAIGEPEAAEAMRLCDEAGIDIKAKSIWRDREKILVGLKTGELKNWLENHMQP